MSGRKRSIKPYPYEHDSPENLDSLTHLGLVPERKICANPGLKFCLFFVFYFPMYILLRLKFCVVIITVSWSKCSTVILYKAQVACS